MRVRSFMRRHIAALALWLVAFAAAAQDAFPSRPISLIVPFPPGGVADIVGRPFADALSRELKTPVVIENKTGAGGGIGMGFVAKAKPDGYTLLLALSSISILPAADKVIGRPPLYQLDQLTPIARLTADPTVLAVRVESPWKTLQDFVDDARKRPGAINYGSSGNYGTMHVPMEMFAQSAGIKLLHVPFTGAGPAVVALLGGTIEAVASGPSTVIPHVKAGKLRVLASWGDKRLASLPDIPTLTESGYDVVFDLSRAVVVALAGVAALANEMVGWPYHHDLDLTGFIDGTENPTLVEAAGVALIPDGSPGEGGSVLLLQQWEHDAIGWEGLPVQEQEGIIGRRKADSSELDPVPASSHVGSTDQDRFGKIFRRNIAYGTLLRHGTIFVGFSRDQRTLQAMLVACAASAVITALLSLVGNEPRRVIALAASSVLGVASFLYVGPLIRRFGGQLVLAVGVTLYVGMYMGMALTRDPAVFGAFYALPLFSLVNVSANALASEYSMAAQRGGGLGVLNGTYALATIVGPVTAGLLADRFGLGAIPWLSFTFLLSSVPIAWLQVAATRRRRAESEEMRVDAG